MRPSLSAVAVVLMAVTALSTLLAWTSDGDDSVIGVRHDDAFLVIAAAIFGIALTRINAKPAWIAAGFAVFVQYRDMRQIVNADLDIGIGLWIGLVAAIGATGALIVDLLSTIRAASPDEDAAADL